MVTGSVQQAIKRYAIPCILFLCLVGFLSYLLSQSLARSRSYALAAQSQALDRQLLDAAEARDIGQVARPSNLERI
jgi:hypothetical protein